MGIKLLAHRRIMFEDNEVLDGFRRWFTRDAKLISVVNATLVSFVARYLDVF